MELLDTDRNFTFYMVEVDLGGDEIHSWCRWDHGLVTKKLPRGARKKVAHETTASGQLWQDTGIRGGTYDLNTAEALMAFCALHTDFPFRIREISVSIETLIVASQHQPTSPEARPRLLVCYGCGQESNLYSFDREAFHQLDPEIQIEIRRAHVEEGGDVVPIPDSDFPITLCFGCWSPK